MTSWGCSLSHMPVDSEGRSVGASGYDRQENDVHPILVDFGTVTIFGAKIPIVIGSYGLVFALAIVTGWLLARALGTKVYPDAPWMDLYFGSIVSGFLGAKLANALVFLPDLLAGRKSFAGILLGGGVWLGGAIAGAGFAWMLSRRHGLDFGIVTNVFFTGIPLAHGLGRIGCLLGGCCYGGECSLPWAITYTSELAHRLNGTPLHVALHPAPVYEFLLEMMNFAICYTLWRRKPKPWTIMPVWLGLYGIERFGLEFLRSDARGQFGWLTTSQWISLAMVVAALTFFALRRRRAPREDPASKARRRRRR